MTRSDRPEEALAVASTAHALGPQSDGERASTLDVARVPQFLWEARVSAYLDHWWTFVVAGLVCGTPSTLHWLRLRRTSERASR